MKFTRIILATIAVAFAFPAVLPANAAECKQTAVYDASTNGSTKLVTGTSALRVYVCGYTLVGGGTATVKLVSGTGTACATGETALTPAYSLVAQTVVADNSPIWRGLTAQPGQDLCIKTSAGVAVQAIVYYTQQ